MGAGIEVVGTGQGPLLGEVLVGGVPHLGDVVIDPTDAAVDGVLGLPETVFGLPTHLAGVGKARGGHGLLELETEVGVQAGENRQRNVADTEVGGFAKSLAVLGVADLDPIAVQMDAIHGGAGDDGRGQIFLEADHQLVHAAHRLEQGRLPQEVPRLVEVVEGGNPVLGLDEFVEAQGRLGGAALVDGFRPATAGTGGAVVGVVGAQITEAAHQIEEALAILVIEFAIELTAIDGLGEHFGHVAAHVVVDTAIELGLTAEGLIRLKAVDAVVHDVDLEGHVQITAIADQAAVVVGDAARTGVDVETLVEHTGLGGAVQFVDGVAAAHGVVAAADPLLGFQDEAFVTHSFQFVGGGQATDAGAQDQDFLSLAHAPRRAHLDILADMAGKAHGRHGVEQSRPHHLPDLPASRNLCASSHCLDLVFPAR